MPAPTYQHQPQTWFITGCTSGFGERLVRQNLARGDRVICGGRDAVRRAQLLSDLGAHVVDLDLTWDHVRIEKVVREAIDHCGGHIDYLFSVAGYGYLDAFEELDQIRILESLQVNLHGHINVTRAVLPFMRAQRSGRIAVMSSDAGWVGEPGLSAYCMAKFALEGFISSLAIEVEPLNIQTLLVEPGTHRTPWGLTGHFDRSRQPRYHPYDKLRGEIDGLPSIWYADNPGNPDIAVRRMIETLTGTGLAAGKAFPPRLPLGRDALKSIRMKCVDTLRLLLDWEDVIVSTDDRSIDFPTIVVGNNSAAQNGSPAQNVTSAQKGLRVSNGATQNGADQSQALSVQAQLKKDLKDLSSLSLDAWN